MKNAAQRMYSRFKRHRRNKHGSNKHVTPNVLSPVTLGAISGGEEHGVACGIGSSWRNSSVA